MPNAISNSTDTSDLNMTPIAFAGVLITILITVLVIMATYLMMDVRSPDIYATGAPPVGKET